MLKYFLQQVQDVTKKGVLSLLLLLPLIWCEHDITLCPQFPSITVSLQKVNGTVGPSSVTSPAQQSSRVLPLLSFLQLPALNPFFLSFFFSTLAHHISPLARLWNCLFIVIIFQESSCSYASPKFHLVHQFFMIALSTKANVQPTDRLICILIRMEMTGQLFFQLRTKKRPKC